MFTNHVSEDAEDPSLLQIRPAKTTDVAAMKALEERAPDAAHWLPSRYEEAVASSGLPRLALVAEGEGGILGFVVAGSAADEWEIENLVVALPARRQGLGTRLMETIIQRAKLAGAAAVFLEVRESNQAGRDFYECLQFAQAGRRRGYYRDPAEDALVYRLDLS